MVAYALGFVRLGFILLGYQDYDNDFRKENREGKKGGMREIFS